MALADVTTEVQNGKNICSGHSNRYSQARGAVEIIVATIGLQMGILTTQMYTIIVIMAVATSMMAPPLLRWSLRSQTEIHVKRPDFKALGSIQNHR